MHQLLTIVRRRLVSVRGWGAIDGRGFVPDDGVGAFPAPDTDAELDAFFVPGSSRSLGCAWCRCPKRAGGGRKRV